MTRKVWIVSAVIASGAVGVLTGALALRPGGPATPVADRVLYYRDPMNPARTSSVPRKDEMGMDYVPVLAGGEDAAKAAPARGVYVDARMAQSSGVRTEEVRARPLTKVIRTVGHVTYDERRLHDVNAKVSGWIEKLHVDYAGKPVRRGEPLMAIYSPALFSTQQEYLLALRQREATGGDGPTHAQADALVSAARQRLLYFDISEGDVARLERRGAPTKTLTVHSPADGYVVEKSVVQGTQVTAGTPLFKVADLSSVWVLADVYEYELPWVAMGQPATVELPYVPGASFEGRVGYVYPYLAAATRTVKVRIDVRNPAGRVQLRPDMYATVTLRSSSAREVVAVPEQAVIRTGDRSVGVVALGGGWYEPRELQVGVVADGWVEVRGGVSAGERIVTSSQFLIDSESNLRSAVARMAGGEEPRPEEGTTPSHGGAAGAGARGGQHPAQREDGRDPPADAAGQEERGHR